MHVSAASGQTQCSSGFPCPNTYLPLKVLPPLLGVRLHGHRPLPTVWTKSVTGHVDRHGTLLSSLVAVQRVPGTSYVPSAVRNVSTNPREPGSRAAMLLPSDARFPPAVGWIPAAAYQDPTDRVHGEANSIRWRCQWREGCDFAHPNACVESRSQGVRGAVAPRRLQSARVHRPPDPQPEGLTLIGGGHTNSAPTPSSVPCSPIRASLCSGGRVTTYLSVRKLPCTVRALRSKVKMPLNSLFRMGVPRTVPWGTHTRSLRLPVPPQTGDVATSALKLVAGQGLGHFVGRDQVAHVPSPLHAAHLGDRMVPGDLPRELTPEHHDIRHQPTRMVEGENFGPVGLSSAKSHVPASQLNMRARGYRRRRPAASSP